MIRTWSVIKCGYCRIELTPRQCGLPQRRVGGRTGNWRRGQIEPKSRLAMQKAILVANDEMRNEISFVDEQCRALHICRQIENDLRCVRLARAQRSSQRRDGCLRSIQRVLRHVRWRVLASAFIYQR